MFDRKTRLKDETSSMTAKTLSITSSAPSDKRALAEIYDLYSSDIFRYAYRLLNDNQLAEDCVSDTFYRFLVVVRAGASVENIRAYLYRVAHNWITDYYRRQPPPTVSLEENIHFDHEGNPSHVFAQSQDRQRIRAALLNLPPEQRQVIELRFIENWSHEEVAGALGRSVEATRALQHRAVEALRKMLTE
jgi:RNA polymerase sigma-70 factor (ECF subfamily)